MDPATPSLPWILHSPLCGPAFLQVMGDRRPPSKLLHASRSLVPSSVSYATLKGRGPTLSRGRMYGCRLYKRAPKRHLVLYGRHAGGSSIVEQAQTTQD
jgi:hypothetical protein